MKSKFREDVFKECLHDLRKTLLMQRANEVALTNTLLWPESITRTQEIIEECKEKAKGLLEKAQHHIAHLEQDLIDVKKEIEILGGGDFAELAAEQNAIENNLVLTKKELSHATRI
jgi:hypothetical protein